MSKKKVSILIPVFNESKNVHIIYSRISKIIKNEKKYDFEILFTNNCSTDDTLKKIKKLIVKDKKIRVITLSKNFGRNISLFAGLKNITGDLVFLIDADCEDPPEMLSTFIRKYEQGYDLVYGIRNRIRESFFLYIGAKIFYRFTNLFADNEIILDMGEFVLFSKDINQEIIKIKTDKPFIRSELSAVGFKRFGIKYLRSKRKHGKTKYGIFNLLAYAMAGFLSASTFFLRFNAASGTLLLLSNIIAAYLLYQNKMSLDFLIFINTFYLILISIFTSIYLARTHNNILSRSVYVIDKKQSFNNKNLI